MYRFSNAQTLQDWDNSQERSWWIASGGNLMEITRVEDRTGIEGWFDNPGDVTISVPETLIPPRWKQAISIFLPFFPLSLLANVLLQPVTADWSLVFAVLLNVCILTPIMTYLFLPLSTRLLRPWLNKPRRKNGSG